MPHEVLALFEILVLLEDDVEELHEFPVGVEKVVAEIPRHPGEDLLVRGVPDRLEHVLDSFLDQILDATAHLVLHLGVRVRHQVHVNVRDLPDEVDARAIHLELFFCPSHPTWPNNLPLLLLLLLLLFLLLL